MTCVDTSTYGWVDGWIGRWVDGLMGGLVGVAMSNHYYLINLDLIEIVQFCLKIYDLWGHTTYGLVYGWLGGWVVGWVNGWACRNIFMHTPTTRVSP